MAVTVLGMWESKWMEAERTERLLWKQTINAFAVSQWAMCNVHGGPFTSPSQYADLESMLAAHPEPKTFLIPPDRFEGSLSLANYVHPENAIYVFGNTNQSMTGHVTDDDDVVSICTPVFADMFGHAVLAVVLYDRMVKSV